MLMKMHWIPIIKQIHSVEIPISKPINPFRHLIPDIWCRCYIQCYVYSKSTRYWLIVKL